MAEEVVCASIGQTRWRFAVGFRFHPTDRALVELFLKPRIKRGPSAIHPIAPFIEFDVYSTEPWKLPGRFDGGPKRNEQFFFTQRQPASMAATETRAKRDVGDGAGVWKRNSVTPILRSFGEVISQKASLTFTLPSGKGTDYIMIEYLLPSSPATAGQFQAIALCMIHNKRKGGTCIDHVPPAPSPIPFSVVADYNNGDHAPNSQQPCSVPMPCAPAAMTEMAPAAASEEDIFAGLGNLDLGSWQFYTPPDCDPSLS